MRAKFPLFQSHLDLSHRYLAHALQADCIAIDATCGNGKDTLFLAEQVIPVGGSNKPLVYAIDIQQEALESARALVSENSGTVSTEQAQAIRWINGSHTSFPKGIAEGTVSAIIYNLGYLPGGDKSITTTTDSTLESLAAALPLLRGGGVINLTCYPGHAEGAIEEQAILTWMQNLDPRIWSCCHHQWLNRVKSPSLIVIQKAEGIASS